MLGLLALVILFLMAATSHDFWLKNLSPGVHGKALAHAHLPGLRAVDLACGTRSITVGRKLALSIAAGAWEWSW